MSELVAVCVYCADDLGIADTMTSKSISYVLNRTDAGDYCYKCEADYTDDESAYVLPTAEMDDVIAKYESVAR
jgi:hypothetical protein